MSSALRAEAGQIDVDAIVVGAGGAGLRGAGYSDAGLSDARAQAFEFAAGLHQFYP